MLFSILKEFGIETKVRWILTDNATNMLKVRNENCVVSTRLVKLIINTFQGARVFNELRDKAISERESKHEEEEEEEDDNEDPNTQLASLEELERAMELSTGCRLPFPALRLPCVAHKESNITNSNIPGFYIFV